MKSRINYYGYYEVGSYQAIMVPCAIFNSYCILMSFISYPQGEGGVLEALYVIGLFLAILLYRTYPAVMAFYAILPLIYPVFYRWIRLPFVLQGISYGFRFLDLIVFLTAFAGFIFHRVHLSRAAADDGRMGANDGALLASASGNVACARDDADREDHAAS
jgi:hypothetical protein